MTVTGKNRIMILGPKNDGTYVVEFRTVEGEALAISIPRSEAHVIRHLGATAVRIVRAGGAERIGKARRVTVRFRQMRTCRALDFGSNVPQPAVSKRSKRGS